jgi:hypothetical protein
MACLVLNAGESGKWKPLLKKNSLKGWTFDVLDGSDPTGIYSIKNGLLMVRGKGKSTAVIRTEKDYGNFELMWEWRWPNEPGNSGCLIFCSSPRDRNVWPQSLEIQMANGNAGDFIHIGETIQVTDAQILKNLPEDSWKHRLRINLTDDSEKKPGQWNKGHMIVKDGSVEVYINGDLVNKGWDASARKGAICFQAEKADIDYRNIRIKE